MANIPGATNALPGVFTDVITQSRGVAVPGGSRIAAMIGEGSTDETIVSTAAGGGLDGLNPSYTSATGADGRHFQLQNFPLVSNRTTLFKNGIPLVGTESLIDGNPFSNLFDYRIDITTGKIELQRAHLVDQGGTVGLPTTYYTPLSTNVGDGYLVGPAGGPIVLVDPNAPPETWTIRCSSVQRDALNNPILGTAKFIAVGSVSGARLDVNGNPIIWTASVYGQSPVIISNGTIQFGISDKTVSFREGDGFIVEVASGVLVRNDSLTANYIPVVHLNDPVLLLGMGDVAKRHGFPSITNNLSLGAQLAFENNSPSLMTVQAAPPLPRRTSYVLSPAVNSLSSNVDDFIYPLPVGVTPDTNSNIHFFVTNTATNVEKQILPNKFIFYTLDTLGQPTTSQFIFDNTPAPGGNSYAYTVKQSMANVASGFDGYFQQNLAFNNQGTFSSASFNFDSTYFNKILKVIDATHPGNIDTYVINSVSNAGVLYVTAQTSHTVATEHNLRFEVLDPATLSSFIVINHNVVPNGNALRVTIVNSKDASFFDAGWVNALAALKPVECDIVVPLPKQTISVIFQNALSHCLSMSNIKNKKERVLFIGAINGLTPDNLTGAKPAAVEDIGVLEGIQGETVTDILAGNVEDLANYSVPNAFGNTYRAVYFYPDQIVVQAGSDNLLIDGFYIAAAAAGYEAADLRIENPLTNKVLTGFTILRNKMFARSTLESLAGAGVTTLQPVAGGGVVVWGITTSQSGFPEEQEISIVFIRDRVAKTLRAGFQGFIGNPESPDTGAILNTRAVLLLNSLVSQRLITAYADLSVKRDDVDPRQWDITVRVQPTYPVNFIYIKVSLGQL